MSEEFMILEKIIVVVFVLLTVAGLIFIQRHSQRKENETPSDRKDLDSKK
jgi:hypothetical protein